MNERAENAEALEQGIRAIWEKTRDVVMARIDTLETTAAKAGAGTLTPEDRAAAEREAHKLAGSLGTFGFHAGSAAARELEHLVGGSGAVDPQRWAALASQIRASLSSAGA